MSDIILVFVAGANLDSNHPMGVTFKATWEQFDKYIEYIKAVVKSFHDEDSQCGEDETADNYVDHLSQANGDLVPTHYVTINEYFGSYIRYEVTDVHKLKERMSYDTNVYDSREFKD